ncbi:hypothetical protein SDJN03_24316, partial [Cucurbita argyrosperma subsp. sororia]
MRARHGVTDLVRHREIGHRLRFLITTTTRISRLTESSRKKKRRLSLTKFLKVSRSSRLTVGTPITLRLKWSY